MTTGVCDDLIRRRPLWPRFVSHGAGQGDILRSQALDGFKKKKKKILIMVRKSVDV